MRHFTMIITLLLAGLVGSAHAEGGVSCDAEGCPSSNSASLDGTELSEQIQTASSTGNGGLSVEPDNLVVPDKTQMCDTDAFACFHMAGTHN